MSGAGLCKIAITSLGSAMVTYLSEISTAETLVGVCPLCG